MEFNTTQIAYLDALGIDVWMPRDPMAFEAPVSSMANEASPVSHVSPSPQSVAQLPAGQLSTGQVPAGQMDARQAAMAAAGQVLNGPAKQQAPQQAQPKVQLPNQSPSQPSGQQPISQGAATPVSAPSQTTQPTMASAAIAESIPRFVLQFWCYGSGLWMVSSHTNLQPSHHQFVHNLAAYLQGKKHKPKHVGVFSWPMIDAPNIDQSEAVAQTYLQQHLQQLQTLSPLEKLVALDDSQTWLSQSQPICLDTDLDLCLQSPTEKQRVWRLLQSHRLS